MTGRQIEVLGAVMAKSPLWFRAQDHGQRVTLASLYRGRALERRAWRGSEGEADAAYEYRVSSEFRLALATGSRP